MMGRCRRWERILADDGEVPATMGEDFGRRLERGFGALAFNLEEDFGRKGVEGFCWKKPAGIQWSYGIKAERLRERERVMR